jgi:predicted DCC family thiol-disulfide oxidoreductase YuxK
LSNINDILAKQPILIFDGECGFCNRSVLFLVKREKNKKMHFVSQHSQTGKDLLNYFELDPSIDSIVLIRDYSAYIKSCAVLRLTWYMKGLWPLLSFFLIIPPFIRNRFYEFIAKRRMKIFGRVESCALLDEEDLKRIL